MPNIKSAKKRVKVNATKAAANKSRKSNLKTVLKKADAAVTSGVAEITYAELADEIGIRDGSTILVCGDDNTKIYGTKLDGSGYGYAWYDLVSITSPSETTTGENKDTYAVAKDGKLTVAIQKETTVV